MDISTRELYSGGGPAPGAPRVTVCASRGALDVALAPFGTPPASVDPAAVDWSASVIVVAHGGSGSLEDRLRLVSVARAGDVLRVTVELVSGDVDVGSLGGLWLILEAPRSAIAGDPRVELELGGRTHPGTINR